MDVPEGDLVGRIQNYHHIVLAYEELNDKINHLITINGGGTEKMTPEDVHLYRQLARQRDEALNQMRWLEQQLLDEDNIQ